MKTLLVKLPYAVPAALNPNGDRRSHWAVHAARKKAHRQGALAARVALQAAGFDAFRPAAYTVHAHWCGVGLDADNALARVKTYMDGMCETLGVDDRTLECMGIFRQKMAHVSERAMYVVFWSELPPVVDDARRWLMTHAGVPGEAVELL